MVNNDAKLRELEALVESKLSQLHQNIPNNVIDFIEKYQPTIGRKPHNFDLSPFWIEALLDNHKQKIFSTGRQVYKSTNSASLVAWYALKEPRSEVLWIVDTDAHRSAFSESRLRDEVFIYNDNLRPFLKTGRANLTRIRVNNGSTIFLLTDHNAYNQAEGRSSAALILDEAQYQDIEFLYKAMYTTSQTHGDLIMFGIGGEMSSPYHEYWNASDQREWFYDDAYWREKLTFDAFGNIINTVDELKSILAGKWIPQKPENTKLHGYHIPQTIMPTIPLTMDDAITKYQTHPEVSVEYQRLHYPPEIFHTHTMGEFIHARRRPVTAEMVRKCFVPYIDWLDADEVVNLKLDNPTKLRVYAGIDWGSGNKSASKTVLSIVLHWLDSNRVQLARLDPRPYESQYAQVAYMSAVINEYMCDATCADLGYGAFQSDILKKGGYDENNNKILPVKRYQPVQSTGSGVDSFREKQIDSDTEGSKKQHINMDKTISVESIIGVLGQTVPHPLYRREEQLFRPRLIIPYREHVLGDMLLKGFTSITRKDIQDEKEADPRQFAKKEYNHIDDSVMSLIYAMINVENYRPSDYSITVPKRRR